MKKLIVFILLLFIVPVYADFDIPDNAYGVISIPCIKVEMPFYTADNVTEQQIIDAEQSALYYQWQTAYRIVDHAFSDGVTGVWNIQKMFAGCTAYLYVQDKCYWYECYMTALTEYTGDEEYINGRIITPCSSKDLMIACCAEDVHHHFVAVFRLKKAW